MPDFGDGLVFTSIGNRQHFRVTVYSGERGVGVQFTKPLPKGDVILDIC